MEARATLQYNVENDELDAQLYKEYKGIGKRVSYGTSGFRSLASHMPYLAYRASIFVTYLNRTNPKKSLGIVVSASHNKIQDNGLKISNFNGNMLEKQYQPLIEAFVEQPCLKKAIQDLQTFLESKNLPCFTKLVTICIGGDTRPTTRNLLDLIGKGVENHGGRVLDFGEVTTPQLHFYVHYLNNLDCQKKTVEEIKPIYWEYFSKYYQQCCKYLKSSKKRRVVDCANGIGAKALPFFNLQPYLDCTIINNDHPQLLNEKCGADYVNTNKVFPMNHHSDILEHVSFDGDADRIVLFYNAKQSLLLIDGARIAVLYAAFFTRLLQELREATAKMNELENIHIALDFDWQLAVAQTYYINSGATEFLLKDYGLQVIYAATGVKYLHQKVQHKDIGVYFESNGHGTALIGNKIKKVDALVNNYHMAIQPQTKQTEEYFRLLSFFKNACSLANPGVGDAITDFLLVEVALDYLKLDYEGLLSMYKDYPSKTIKINVKDKNAIKVTEVADRVLEPAGLQELIEEACKKHGGLKAFLRASGTEDILRLHVEAPDMEAVDKIANDIKDIIKNCKELQ